MGSWGVKATESDYGLDLLATVTDKLLHKSGYKRFNVKEASELLKAHIIAGIKRTNEGCSEDDMQFYIDITFPGRYGEAAILLAECLAEFCTSGALVVGSYDNETRKLTEQRITEFAFTKDDLTALLKDLQSVLDPEHDIYHSWKNSGSFEEWQTHITALCESLETRIAGYSEITE